MGLFGYNVDWLSNKLTSWSGIDVDTVSAKVEGRDVLDPRSSGDAPSRAASSLKPSLVIPELDAFDPDPRWLADFNETVRWPEKWRWKGHIMNYEEKWYN